MILKQTNKQTTLGLTVAINELAESVNVDLCASTFPRTGDIMKSVSSDCLNAMLIYDC